MPCLNTVYDFTGDLDHTISPTVRPTQTPPTTDRGTDPHLPSPFTSPSVEAETLFPRITDEVKDTPISLFPDARLRDFNLDAWTERCVRELKEANQELSGSLLVSIIFLDAYVSLISLLRDSNLLILKLFLCNRSIL